MEVYVLDSLLRRTQVIDVFESLIWTERFAEIGDFELSVKSTLEARNQLTTGTHLVINNSYRVMTVETVEDTTDDEGKALLHVKGRSLETLLEDRAARDSTADLTVEPVWVISDTPGNVARTMFEEICVNGVLAPEDIIPFIGSIEIFPEDTLPEPGVEITWRQSPDSLYNAIKKICDVYDLGFRLTRNVDTSQLKFDIYAGSDRTSRQTDLTPVIFSVSLDNLQNTTEFSTIAQTKNVAYVFSPFGTAIVLGDNVESDINGFERKVLVVDGSSDVDESTVDVVGVLTQRGQQELASYRTQSYFDGELNENSEFKYGTDYQLGDLVELRNIDGVISYKRVTEQIFVSDKEGDRSYPTLSLDLFLGITSWQSYGNKPTQWIDFTTEFWEDM